MDKEKEEVSGMEQKNHLPVIDMKVNLENKKEGRGIYYYSNGDREMGDYFNDKSIGKQVMLTKNNEVKVINY